MFDEHVSLYSCLLGIFRRPDDGLDDEGVSRVGDAGEAAVDDVSRQGEAVDQAPDEEQVHALAPNEHSHMTFRTRTGCEHREAFARAHKF